MTLQTKTIWETYNTELYFFVLKKVKDTDKANDIVQNSFLKIHKNLDQLKDDSKIKQWIFQIARNEILNYYNQSKVREIEYSFENEFLEQQYNTICCFDRFVGELPKKYKEVIHSVYFKGRKLSETASELDISLANVKARVRRGKKMLSEKLMNCCKFDQGDDGKLKGEPNCNICD